MIQCNVFSKSQLQKKETSSLFSEPRDLHVTHYSLPVSYIHTICPDPIKPDQ